MLALYKDKEPRIYAAFQYDGTNLKKGVKDILKHEIVQEESLEDYNVVLDETNEIHSLIALEFDGYDYFTLPEIPESGEWIIYDEFTNHWRVVNDTEFKAQYVKLAMQPAAQQTEEE